MFERYTEKARRVIFFARYEASQYGSPAIETEHLLLGLVREDQGLVQRLLPGTTAELIRHRVDAHMAKGESFPTSIDLPLSEESKNALKAAAEEADRFNHRHIGTEHLLLGLLRQEKSLAAKIVQEQAATLADLRLKIEKLPSPWSPRVVHPSFTLPPPAQATVEIHGARRNGGPIREAVRRCHDHPWRWHKQAWMPRDIVIEHTSGRVSLDLTLAADESKFKIVKDGWTRDHCAICGWELFKSDDHTHSEGYTNGRDWLCTECYEKFLQGPDFFSSAYWEMT